MNNKEKISVRKLVETIGDRIDKPSPLIQVVVGPRQVGKTTALRQVLSESGGIYHTADFPTPLPSSVIEEWWSEALESKSRILGIDEIQKIEGWSEAVKWLWDQPSAKLKLVVTGSAALTVEKGLRESLAGRYELIRVEHWNFSEAKEIFSLGYEQYVEFGCYPGSIQFFEDIDRWGAYVRDAIVEPAIGRDLLQLYPIDQPALLRQVFGLAVTRPAEVVSLQKMVGQLQGRGTLPTIQNYLHLLGQAFLVTGIDKYSSSSFRTKRSSPKLIVHDNALLRAFRRPIREELPSDVFGRYLENQVGARFLEAGWDTYYWKDRNLEVDFVVSGPGGEKWAIEVKSSETSSKELKGLLEFCRRHKEFKPCLVSPNAQDLPGIAFLDVRKVLSLSRGTNISPG